MLLAHLHLYQDEESFMRLLSSRLTEKNDIWWISILNEKINIDHLNTMLLLIKQFATDNKQKLSNIRLVINDSVDTSKLKTTYGIKIGIINYFRMLTYYHKYHNVCSADSNMINQQFNCRYSNKKNKALFLLGKPHRPHRTPVLIELIRRGMKNKLTYSWHPGRPGSKLFESVKHSITYDIGNDFDLESFSRLHSATLDISEKQPMFHEDESCYHYSGFPFDMSLFENTSCSIVCESEYITTEKNLPWTTEKIWRAIANHHPFILIGESGIIPKLRTLGYETWDSFLKHDQHRANLFWVDRGNFDSIAVKMATDNVEYFLNNPACEDKLRHLALKNSNLMDKHVQEEIEQVFDGDINLFERLMNGSKYDNLHKGKSINDIINKRT